MAGALYRVYEIIRIGAPVKTTWKAGNSPTPASPGSSCDTGTNMASPQRVLVTRAAQQGSALAEHLGALGLEPVLVPALELLPPSRPEALEAALSQLERVDWVVVSSVNAVPVLAASLQAGQKPPKVRVAAIGWATAAALEAAGIAVDLVPPAAVSESLADALLPFARDAAGDAGRFLLVRAEEGRDHLPDRLRLAGAEVAVAPAYRTVIPHGSVALLQDALSPTGKGVQAITLTSASTVRNLLALCEAAQMSLPRTALRVSIGPITTAALREAGYPAHAQSPAATVASLAETVARLLSGQDGAGSGAEMLL